MADVAQTLPNTKAELIVSFVQRELKSKVTLLPTVTDVSRFAVKGAKSISFPKLTSYSIVDRTFGVAGDATALTDSIDKLDLEWNAYCAAIIDSSDEVQSSIEFKMESLTRMAAAHGRYVDSKISAVLAGSYADAINAAAANVTEGNIIDLRTALIKNEVDVNSMFLAISPDQEAAILKIANFVRADSYGVSNIPNGVVGRLFGFNVVINTQLVAYSCYAYSPEAIVLGFQKAPAMSEQPANEYGANGVRIAMDQLFGIKAIHTAEGVDLVGTPVASGKSGLIFSVNP